LDVTSDSTDDLVAGAGRLQAAEARRVMVSRGSNPVIFRDDGPRPTEIELAARWSKRSITAAPAFRCLGRSASDSRVG
jgi:hypothetical protein